MLKGATLDVPAGELAAIGIFFAVSFGLAAVSFSKGLAWRRSDVLQRGGRG